MSTNAERLAVLETQMKDLKDRVESMDAKLDDLLTLRHKGVGAFWLASMLFGTGIAGALLGVISWFKGA